MQVNDTEVALGMGAAQASALLGTGVLRKSLGSLREQTPVAGDDGGVSTDGSGACDGVGVDGAPSCVCGNVR